MILTRVDIIDEEDENFPEYISKIASKASRKAEQSTLDAGIHVTKIRSGETDSL